LSAGRSKRSRFVVTSRTATSRGAIVAGTPPAALGAPLPRLRRRPGRRAGNA
jgi:hypothetical protein